MAMDQRASAEIASFALRKHPRNGTPAALSHSLRRSLHGSERTLASVAGMSTIIHDIQEAPSYDFGMTPGKDYRVWRHRRRRSGQKSQNVEGCG